MDWYPRYIALWRAKTWHLDPYQEGCYLRLVDQYMESRQPLPDNDAALARICGISLEQWLGNASGILRAFFIPKNGLLYHDKCDKILAEQDMRFKKQSEKSRKGAEARWRKNKDLDATGIQQALPKHATRQDKTIQDNESFIDPLPPKPKKPIEVLPEWLPEELWKNFVDHRRAIKKPMGDKAKSLAIATLTKLRDQGNDPRTVIETSIFRGWSGLFAVKNHTTNQASSDKKPSYSDDLISAMSGAISNLERNENHEIP